MQDREKCLIFPIQSVWSSWCLVFLPPVSWGDYLLNWFSWSINLRSEKYSNQRQRERERERERERKEKRKDGKRRKGENEREKQNAVKRRKRTKHTHRARNTHTDRERERKEERKKNYWSKIRFGATILTEKSKWFTKNDRSKAWNKKKKEETKRMERRNAIKRKQLPFFIPQTQTGEHKPTRVAWCWLEIFMSTNG